MKNGNQEIKSVVLTRDETNRLDKILLELDNLSWIYDHITQNSFIISELRAVDQNRIDFVKEMKSKYDNAKLIPKPFLEGEKERQYSDTIFRLYSTNSDDSSSHLTREITVQVTSDCNLNCSYCYENHKAHERMSLETGKQIVDFIYRSAESTNEKDLISSHTKAIIFNFIGGEPMLEASLIEDIMRYFIEEGCRRKSPLLRTFRGSASSNGQNYFSSEVQHLIDVMGGLFSLNISIDGVKELHDKYRVDFNGRGSFDKAFAAFQDCREKGLATSKMTFVPGSFKYIFDSVKFMLENGCMDISCNYAFEPEYTEEDGKLLYQELKKVADYKIENNLDTFISILDMEMGAPLTEDLKKVNFCGGTGNMLSFAPDGKAYPCIRYAPISVGSKAEKMLVGDTSGIFNTHLTIKLKDYLDSVTLESQSTDECINCPVAKGCGWCSGYNYDETGDVNTRITHICKVHKARCLAHYYYMNQRYLTLGKGKPVLIHLPVEEALHYISIEEWNLITDLELKAISKYLNSLEIK